MDYALGGHMGLGDGKYGAWGMGKQELRGAWVCRWVCMIQAVLLV